MDTRRERPEPLVFLHVGDLHLTRRSAQNACDLRAILEQIDGIKPQRPAIPPASTSSPETEQSTSAIPPYAFDFVYLPGDLAEDGYRVQYEILKDALDDYPDLPVRLIVGDHDRQHGTMHRFDAFFRDIAGSPRGGKHQPVEGKRLPRPEVMRPVTQYYYAEDIGGVRCLFLDMISAGYGRKGMGLDFRLELHQRLWLQDEVLKARAERRPIAVFMHTYPADLTGEEPAEVAGLFWNEGVSLVEIGHTHYNEIAHDGRTLYAAARSVGQNEDGSVGYAVVVLDRGVTSWRFRPLDKLWPFVVITGPSDVRLARAPLVPGADGRIEARALVLSDQDPGTCECVCRVDAGPWLPMAREPRRRCFTARVPWPPGSRTLSVRATDGRWGGFGHRYVDTDSITPPGRDFRPPERPALPGSDAFALPAWPEKGVRGDQLGPNRNGRPW